MTKTEKMALGRTLKDAGIKGETKKFWGVDLASLREMCKTIKAQVSPADLWAEYQLNLQELAIDKLAENHGRG